MPIGEFQERIRIDIVRPLFIMKRENKYIVIYIDYMMKQVEAKPLPNKLAVQVMWFIYEKIICKYGCSTIIQSDNKLKFVNEVIKQLLDKFRI